MSQLAEFEERAKTAYDMLTLLLRKQLIISSNTS